MASRTLMLPNTDSRLYATKDPGGLWVINADGKRYSVAEALARWGPSSQANAKQYISAIAWLLRYGEDIFTGPAKE